MQQTSRESVWPLACVGALVVVGYAMAPGSTPFVYDESLLLMSAFECNARHTLANVGLFGSLGRQYGPLPTWIYQGLLLVSHDLVTLMCLRIVLYASVLVGAVVWLTRTTRLWRWGGLTVLLSPYVWMYARHMWDNTFNIPLGFLALAAYAAFVCRPSGLRLFVATLLTGMMLLIHPMALPFAGALAVMLVWQHWVAVRERVRSLILAMLVLGCMSGPYLVKFFAGDNLSSMTSAITVHPTFGALAVFSLLSPGSFSGYGLEIFFRAVGESGAGYLHDAGAWSVAYGVAVAISLLAFPFALMGIVRAAGAWRSGHFEGGQPADSTHVIVQLARFSLIAFVFQIVITLGIRLIGGPHYYNGVLAPVSFLLWMTLDWLASKRWYRPLVWGYLASLATITVLLAVRVHATHGVRSIHFGSVLADQVRVAHQIQALPANASVENKTLLNSIALLGHQTLMSPLSQSGTPSTLPGAYILRYVHPENPYNAALELVPASSSEP